MAKHALDRNDPCSCGSGLKYKRCCGKIVRTFLFDHPDFKDVKDVKAPSLDDATAAFESWWHQQVIANRLPSNVRPFTAGKVYAEDDDRAVAKAASYVSLELKTVGATCADCRQPTFRYAAKGSQHYCVGCFVKMVGVEVDPARVKGFYYNEAGKLVLDLEDLNTTEELTTPETSREVFVAADDVRCKMVCPHGDRCRLEAGHEQGVFEGTGIPVGCSHLMCPCNEPNGPLWKCACGWSGSAAQLVTGPGELPYKSCPTCGGGGGLVLA